MDDREWMYKGWQSEQEYVEFALKVNGFLKKAFDRGQSRMPCPCSKCENRIHQSKLSMGKHIIRNGFVENYPGGSAMVKPIVREKRLSDNASMIMMLKPVAQTC